MVFILVSLLGLNVSCWVHGKINDLGMLGHWHFFTHNFGITSALFCFCVGVVGAI